jgi:TPR repeat protein
MEAQYRLGLLHRIGEALPKDDAKAAYWFLQAADQGHVKAQANLGVMYAHGEGVVPDLVLAYFLLDLAAAQGNGNAVNNRDLVAEHMTPEEIGEARQMVEEWRPTRQITL